MLKGGKCSNSGDLFKGLGIVSTLVFLPRYYQERHRLISAGAGRQLHWGGGNSKHAFPRVGTLERFDDILRCLPITDVTELFYFGDPPIL